MGFRLQKYIDGARLLEPANLSQMTSGRKIFGWFANGCAFGRSVFAAE
jgi:hypothetical protein